MRLERAFVVGSPTRIAGRRSQSSGPRARVDPLHRGPVDHGDPEVGIDPDLAGEPDVRARGRPRGPAAPARAPSGAATSPPRTSTRQVVHRALPPQRCMMSMPASSMARTSFLPGSTSNDFSPSTVTVGMIWRYSSRVRVVAGAESRPSDEIDRSDEPGPRAARISRLQGIQAGQGLQADHAAGHRRTAPGGGWRGRWRRPLPEAGVERGRVGPVARVLQ